MNKRNGANLLISNLCLLAICLGCAGMQKPWRSYDQKPFDAKAWKTGDNITRGTMAEDLAGIQPIQEKVGKNKADIFENLGEPTFTRNDKIGERNVTVLIYEVDLGKPEFMDALQVFLDEDEIVVFANMGVTKEKESIFELW